MAARLIPVSKAVLHGDDFPKRQLPEPTPANPTHRDERQAEDGQPSRVVTGLRQACAARERDERGLAPRAEPVSAGALDVPVLTVWVPADAPGPVAVPPFGGGGAAVWFTTPHCGARQRALQPGPRPG